MRPKLGTQKRKDETDSWPYVRWIESRQRWQVDARTRTGGERRFFQTKEDAMHYRQDMLSLRGETGNAVFQSEELEKAGLSLHEAIRLAVAYKKQEAALANVSKTLEEATRDTLKEIEKVNASVTLSVAIISLVNAKKAAGRSKEYTRDLKTRLEKLSEYLGEDRVISTITAEELDTFLRTIPVAATRNTVRRDLCTLWSYGAARGRRWCHVDEASSTEIATQETDEIGILTVEEITALLRACDEETLPATVLAAFVPLRQSELNKLDWSRVHLDEKVVVVDSKIAKTRSRRTVSIPDNAIEWLRPLARRSGLVKCSNFRNKFDRVRVKAGFKPSFMDRRDAEVQRLLADARKAGVKLKDWPNNALRHSAISYRVALANNIAGVADDSGNSLKIIRTNYLKLVLPSKAKAYSEIVPHDEDEEYRQTIEKLFNADLAAKALKARKEAKNPAAKKGQVQGRAKKSKKEFAE